MRALSVIGIIMSVGGLITSLYVMTEARCHCYCNDDYLYSSGSVPGDAIGGSLVMMIIFVFFLVFSIVSAAKYFGKNADAGQTIPPFQANPFQQQQPVFQQPYVQPYQPQYPSNPNPYQQPNPFQPNPNPYQNPQNPTPPPTNTPPTNPWEPPRQ